MVSVKGVGAGVEWWPLPLPFGEEEGTARFEVEVEGTKEVAAALGWDAAEGEGMGRRKD